MQTKPELSRGLALQLVATASIALAPHLIDQAGAIAALSALLLIWRAWIGWRELGTPPRLLLFALAGIATGLVWINYHTLLGRNGGLALLSLLLPLKLLEGRSRRDARVALLLCCFLLTGQFLISQTFAAATFAVATLVAILAASAALENPVAIGRKSFRIALRLMAIATPLSLALFLFFPRFDGPLWGLPTDAFSARSGLSDTMAPGSISKLIKSSEIAFRVEFAGTPPPPAERYWRGPVLSRFDGQTWSPIFARRSEKPPYTVSGRGYAYTMTIEPHNQRWLLALDFPAPSDAGLITEDLSLRAREPILSRKRYSLVSHPATMVGLSPTATDISNALALPPKSNPETQALGARLLREETDPTQRVVRGIAFMRHTGLLYTLNPPLLGAHTADDFLFRSHRGFCEHFASAFAIMMRAAGVPARVVTGYQGGEFNPVDGAFIVRQSDAHAWTEVWLKDRGWVRIDPTAASAPTRIDDGIAEALSSTEDLPFALRQDLSFLRQLRFGVEALSNRWNQWVLGYNAQRQQELLRQFGLPDADWERLIALLTACAGLWMLWLVQHSLPRTAPYDPLDRVWRRMCRKMARAGLPRFDWETPVAFAKRAAMRWPHHAITIREIAERYSALRHGRTPPHDKDIAALRAAIKNFTL